MPAPLVIDHFDVLEQRSLGVIAALDAISELDLHEQQASITALS